ncbi:hypothetical protein [Spongiactinospora sp. TRM90649]|uniref:hypothetical protein n=1 Tax=Spongiactinospora sp. TRM90649 TaxID=3031114 RepID=UPI0023F72F3A|nr:hypothetical protein [Spongiactinospora sp. TRM90649]MDF5752503.1 hypothetical protein [Spongiactinospora sp. TRM90649]
MSGESIRVLGECRRRGERLRAQGFGVDQIAAVLALDHQVSPLRLYRYVHGHTAAEVTSAHNVLDPAGTATLRVGRLYDYEGWPRTGRRPPARSLAIFARIYQTAARNLLTDEVYATYRPGDRELIDRAVHGRCDSTPYTTGMHQRPVPPPALSSSDGGVELLRAVRAEEADLKRRELLFEAAMVFGGVPAVPLLRHLSPHEQERLSNVARSGGRVDGSAMTAIEKVIARCRSLDDAVGPKSVLPVATAQRGVVADLLDRGSLMPATRDRLTRCYAELCQLTGWLHADLLEFAEGQRHFQDGISAAHAIGDPTLLAYLHTCASNAYRNEAKIGQALDHAFAATTWGRRSPSHAVRSVCAMDMARAFAMNGDTPSSEQMFASARQLAAAPRAQANPSYLYWWSPGAVDRSAADCLLTWGKLDDVIASVQRTLASRGLRNLDRAYAHLVHADALIARRDIREASLKIREAVTIATTHSSNRLVRRIQQSRARLRPWADNRHVRDLDEELRGLTTSSEERAPIDQGRSV